MISISTLEASAGSMPLSPTEKYIWRRSLSRPTPATSSPRPDSISARRRGEPGRPSRMCSNISKAKLRSTSAVSHSSQFMVTMPRSSPSEAA